MDPRMKTALAVAIGVALMGSAVAIPAAFTTFSRAVADDDELPMMQRPGMRGAAPFAQAPDAERPRFGPMGPDACPEFDADGRIPGFRGPRGGGALPPCGGDRDDCPIYPGTTGVQEDTSTQS